MSECRLNFPVWWELWTSTLLLERESEREHSWYFVGSEIESLILNWATFFSPSWNEAQLMERAISLYPLSFSFSSDPPVLILPLIHKTEGDLWRGRRSEKLAQADKWGRKGFCSSLKRFFVRRIEGLSFIMYTQGGGGGKVDPKQMYVLRKADSSNCWGYRVERKKGSQVPSGPISYASAALN